MAIRLGPRPDHFARCSRYSIEGDGAVVLLILGGAKERDRSLLEPLAQDRDHVALVLQFRPVPRAALGPLPRVMPEPPAHLPAGGDPLQPEVNRRLLLVQPSGPEPLHEDPQSDGSSYARLSRILALRLLISKLLPHPHQDRSEQIVAAPVASGAAVVVCSSLPPDNTETFSVR